VCWSPFFFSPPPPLWGGGGGGREATMSVDVCASPLDPHPYPSPQGGGEIKRSQKPRRPHQRAPHMRRRRIVEAEAFLRLLEVAADDVDEVVEVDLGVGIERIDV